MVTPSMRSLALLSAIAAGVALGVAEVSEHWGGLVPCALCLVERWPYRVASLLSLIAFVLPRVAARWLLVLTVVTIMIGAGFAFVHVGVELHFWPSPLPECAAPTLGTGSIAERLAQMPVRPSKPCDAPTFLIPGLPLSMAAMNLIYAAVFAVILMAALWRERRQA